MDLLPPQVTTKQLNPRRQDHVTLKVRSLTNTQRSTLDIMWDYTDTGVAEDRQHDMETERELRPGD